MCDIQLVREHGRTWFAKNSDREPGEPQLVVSIPATRGDRRPRLRTTYLEIAETADRNAILLSKPAWIWGAEMGANDQGLVIGNTALFSKVQEGEAGLIGMDLLRLGVERASTARHALDVITELLSRHGQGGACGYRRKGDSYDNAFILADPEEAWVLETAQRHWVARRIERHWALSNWMSIGRDYDLASPGIADFARKMGLLRHGEEFDFAGCFQQRFMPLAAGAPWRWRQSMSCLAGVAEDGWFRTLWNHLRSHRRGGDSALMRSNDDVCMHAGGYIRRSQTCGTMLSALAPEGHRHFFTGTSAPCLSILKPALADGETWEVLHPNDLPLEESLWHRHEAIHRRALFDRELRAELRRSLDLAEEKMLPLVDGGADVSDDAVLRAAEQIAMEWQEIWCERVPDAYIGSWPPTPYRRFWRGVG